VWRTNLTQLPCGKSLLPPLREILVANDTAHHVRLEGNVRNAGCPIFLHEVKPAKREGGDALAQSND